MSTEKNEVDSRVEKDEVQLSDEEEDEDEEVEGDNDVDGEPHQEGGNPSKFDKFDDFLRKRAVLNGGAKDDDEDEYREGYDSFTIVEASGGEVGGRFISKTPYSAASKAASRLFKSASGKNITFVMKKITKGSNKKFYAYEASIKMLAKPKYIFKKDEAGNKITMNNSGQIVKLNKNNKVINTSDNVSVEYNPERSLSKLKSFDYKPYIIKQVSKEITIKATDIPDEYKVKKEKKADKLTKEEKQLLKTEKKQKEQELKELIKENKKQEKEQLKIQKEIEKEQLKIQKEIQKIDTIPDKKKVTKQHERELHKKNKDLDKELLKIKKDNDKENKKLEQEQLKLLKEIEKLDKKNDKTEIRDLFKTNKKQEKEDLKLKKEVKKEYKKLQHDLKKLEKKDKVVKGGGGTCSSGTACF
jgi:hypothetical protein